MRVPQQRYQSIIENYSKVLHRVLLLHRGYCSRSELAERPITKRVCGIYPATAARTCFGIHHFTDVPKVQIKGWIRRAEVEIDDEL